MTAAQLRLESDAAEQQVGLEARAAWIAAGRFGVGSDQYHGCRAGFVDGYTDAPPARHRKDAGAEWDRAYWIGFDVGMHASRRDAEQLVERT